MSMVKIWVILLKRTTPTIKWYTAIQIPLFSWENLKRCEVRRLEGRIDNLPGRKKTSVVSPQICTKSLPSYTNLHQVFTKLHQSTQSLDKATPVCNNLHQSTLSLHQTAPSFRQLVLMHIFVSAAAEPELLPWNLNFPILIDGKQAFGWDVVCYSSCLEAEMEGQLSVITSQ